MFERFTAPARQIVVQSQDYARKLGHPFIGPEHLLLGAVTVEDPASALLRDSGVTPEKLQAELLRLTRGADEEPGARVLGGLDRDALASIGIDLDQVQTRIEAAFGQGALSRAAMAQAAMNRPRRRLLGRRRPRGRTGPNSPIATMRGHVPFTRRAKKCMELSLREAIRLGDNYIGVDHVTLALLRIQDGLVPKLLARLDVSPETLRTALLDQHRKAS